MPPPKKRTWVFVLSVVILTIGAIVCFFSGVNLVVVVIMPDSILSYYIQDFSGALGKYGPFVSLLFGIIMIVVGSILLRIRAKR